MDGPLPTFVTPEIKPTRFPEADFGARRSIFSVQMTGSLDEADIAQANRLDRMQVFIFFAGNNVMSEPDWDDIKVILALYRGGSVAAAAQILSVDESTVSRRLSAVEKAMGTILLNRGGREFHFTDEGRTAVCCTKKSRLRLRPNTYPLFRAPDRRNSDWRRSPDGVLALQMPCN